MARIRILPIACAIASITPQLSASRAHACSPNPCYAGYVLPAEGSLPANALQLLWRPPTVDYGSTTVASGARMFVASADASTENELPIGVAPAYDKFQVVIPKVPVPAGSRLRFEYDNPCTQAAGPQHATVLVAAAAERPTLLGSLHGEVKRGPVWVPVNTGECTLDFYASYADLRIELSAEAAPYRDVFHYELRVDGSSANASYGHELGYWAVRPFAGVQALPRGEDKLYALCESRGVFSTGLSPGLHRVRMVGVLPDGTEVPSDEITIELSCEGAPSGDDADALHDAGVHYDERLGRPDSAAPRPLAAAAPDAAIWTGEPHDDNVAAAADPTSPQPPATSEAAEGCQLGRTHARGSLVLTVMALVCGTLTRRRRRGQPLH